MAKKAAKSTKSTKAATSDDNVVRIKAGTSAPKKTKTVAKKAAPIEAEVVAEPAKKAKAEKKPKTKRAKRDFLKPFRAIGGYFKGAWIELRQVRWPTRRATWSFTGAVLVYTAFFLAFVLLLDALFKYLFELLLGK